MLTNVQALRALAAFLVVFVHLRVLAIALGLGPHAVDFGNAGVDVFFVISGMIMVLTTTRRPTGAGEFLRNRVARIVPFYWLVTFIVFALALADPHLFSGTRADPVELVKSMLFVPFRRVDGEMAPIVFVGWTLNYEMAFYALFALGLALPGRRTGLLFTLGVLAAVAGAGLAIQPSEPLAGFYSSPIILEFGLGMVIGALAPRFAEIRLPKAAVMAAGLIAFALMLAGPELWPGAGRLLIFGLPAAVVVASAVYLEGAGLVVTSRLVRRLGDASFATYLTHFFVTQAVVKTVLAFGLHAQAELWLAVAFTFLLVAATGVAAHLALERPLSLAIKRTLTRERRAPAVEPPANVAASTGDMAV